LSTTPKSKRAGATNNVAPAKDVAALQKAAQQDNVRIVLKAFDSKIVDDFVKQIIEMTDRTGADIRGPVPLPTHKKRFIVIRSPHIDKNSREYFLLRVHKRLIDIVKPSKATIEALTHLSAPSGVDISLDLDSNKGRVK